jgi:hypothetical protein
LSIALIVGESKKLMGSKPVSSLSGNLTISHLNITMDKVKNDIKDGYIFK